MTKPDRKALSKVPQLVSYSVLPRRVACAAVLLGLAASPAVAAIQGYGPQLSVSGSAEYAQQIVGADMNGDIDLLLRPAGFNGVPIFAINDGLGSFTLAAPPATLADSRGAEAADMNGDGLLDLIIKDGTSGLAWWPYLGAGTFGTPVGFSDPSFDPRTQDIEAGDLDGDGDLDVAVSASNSDTIGIFSNVGGVLSLDSILVAVPGARCEIDLGDYDGDGDLDVLAVPQTILEAAPVILRNGGGLLFSGPEEFLGTTSAGSIGFSAFDATGDGLRDLFLSISNGPVLAVLSAPSATGGYLLESTPRPLTGRLPLLRDVVSVDFDGDGDLDVISSTRALNAQFFPEQPLAFHENVGADRFRLQVPLAGAPSDTRLLDAGDVDGDGHVDLVTSSSTGDSC